MGFKEDLSRAMHETEVHRSRRSRLLTVGSTELPYVLLCESMVNVGDTVVRRGVVRVEKPSIFLLHRPLQFEGFEDEGTPQEGEAILALGRMASFPPGKYSNIETELDVFEGRLAQALKHFEGQLDLLEDILTGVVSGPVDIWPMSLLVYVGQMVQKSAPLDLMDLTSEHPYRHWS